jgi:hypothetical protein
MEGLMLLQDEIIYQKNAGRMPKNLVLVESHPLDIPQKLREVDPALFIMYNPTTDKYEIHRRGFANTLEMNLPYRELDNRAVMAFVNGRDVWKVKAEIEANNEKIKADTERKTKHEMSCRLRDLHDYCSHHERVETLDKDAYSARFV